MTGREDYAAQHIQRARLECLVPKIETRTSVIPLFAGYLFCNVIDGRWRVIATTIGVIALIRFGEYPARVPDREIEAIKARMDSTGVIKLPPEPPAHRYKRGDRVKVIVAGTLLDANSRGHLDEGA